MSDPNRLSRLQARLFEPVEATRLAYFRVVCGFFMALQALLLVLPGGRSSTGVRLPSECEKYFTGPSFLFKYQGLEWLEPLGGVGMPILLGIMVLAGTGVMVGFLYRICASVYFIGWTYVFFLDQTFYQNHYYLLVLLSLLMVFVPAHHSFSLDARRHPELRSRWIPRWSLLIVQVQLSIVYIGGGIAKITPDWLQGEPMRLWMSQPSRAAKVPILGGHFTEEWLVYLLTYSGLFLDLLIVPALLWRRTRLFALAAITLFHLSNSVLWNIGIFPWFMMLATPMLLPAKYFRFGQPPPAASEIPAPPKVMRRATTLLLAVYLLIQIALPFRHFLYPGDASWTSEGERFAWHMKLRHKEPVGVSFKVSDPVSGESWTLLYEHQGGGREVATTALQSYLTTRQMRYMAIHPDMIHQFSRFLADEFREQGHEQIEVRADARVVLNTRKPQPMVDPEIDLASEPRTLGASRWILPSTAELGTRELRTAPR